MLDLMLHNDVQIYMWFKMTMPITYCDLKRIMFNVAIYSYEIINGNLPAHDNLYVQFLEW